MKNRKIFKKNITNLLMIFMIIQPVLDIYYLYMGKMIDIFKMSPATIIRMLFLIVLLVLTLKTEKPHSKSKKIVFLIIVYVAYILFHHLNATSFTKTSTIYENYHFLKEVFYFIRMIAPFGLIYITRKSELKEPDIKTIVYSVISIFAITIIVTNFLKVSLTSYANGTERILANFFSWFNADTYKTYTYEYIASKGLFHMANQISATLICLLPIEIYFIYKEKLSIGKVLVLLLNLLALLMIGTRVASYGWIFVIVIVTIEYILINLKNKEKISITKIIALGVITIPFFIILPYSPVANRTYASDNNQKIEEQIANSNGEEDRKNIVCNDTTQCTIMKKAYIEKYYSIYGFDPEYIEEKYSYNIDPDFWFQAFDIPYLKRANHRRIKMLITSRVIALNHNIWDYIFGLSFTRLRETGIYMENDVVVHFYSLGIIGLILFILPYIFIAIYSLIKLFKNHNINLISSVYITSIVLTTAAGIVSGNVFDEWIVTLFLGFICGLLIKEIPKSGKKKVLFISSTGGHLEELMQLKPMFNNYDYHIITERTKSNLSLTKKYPNRVNYLVFGTYTTPIKKLTYPFKLIYNTLKSFILYLIINPEYIVSTGAHTAGPMCLIGHLLGSKIIFIETFANSSSKSRTGTLVYKFADLFIVQWESMLELYPNAVYGGWIF